jgi:ABC-type transport system substrate-binding protein
MGSRPWLAESVVNIDPLTWRVMLRANARFHDGSPVTADDVVEAFRRNYAAYPNGDALISKDTQITAIDATTVELKTPQPTGVFPNALTSCRALTWTAPGGFSTPRVGRWGPTASAPGTACGWRSRSSIQMSLKRSLRQ